MRMLQIPFYDPNKSYEENYDQGPFGAFVDREVFQQTAEPTEDFLGQKVYLPFGIPAGPLVNAKFCKSAFEKGFDICVYKTVRSSTFPCHPFPNILAVKIEGDLTPEKAQNKLIADNNYSQPLSITNSFGVPSKDPTVWQEDVKKAISSAGPGQVLVLSFMGTVRENQTPQDFVADYALAAKLSAETGAKLLEANLSCPNIGNEGLVSDEDLKKLVEIAGKYAQGIAAINTISAEVVDQEGNQALPGKNRLKSGVCGAAIKWAGRDMVKRLVKIRQEAGVDLKIIGVGGVTKAEDYFEYRNAGADAVMSATGAMWTPFLAKEIKKKI